MLFRSVYTVTRLTTGNYRLHIYPTTSGASRAWLGEWYNDQPSQSAATSVSVTVGNTVSNINASLTKGGQLIGIITSQDTSQPLHYVDVYAYTSPTQTIYAGSTDASGRYTSTGVVAGNYKIEFKPDYSTDDWDYLREFYNDKAAYASADNVAVTLGALSTADAILARGGTITGTVKYSDTGLVASGVEVDALDSAGNTVRYDYSDSNGYYEIHGLPAGSYRVRFNATSRSVATTVGCTTTITLTNYAALFYNQKLSLPPADAVTVTPPNVTPNINAVMAVGAPPVPEKRKVYLPFVRKS